MCKTANFLGILTILSLLGAGGVALAQDKPASLEEGRAKMLERYDADGDGKISEEERRAAREGRRLERWDADGDGEISDEERAAAYEKRERFRQANLEKYDADGDGRLNREERRKARADGVTVERPGRGRR